MKFIDSMIMKQHTVHFIRPGPNLEKMLDKLETVSITDIFCSQKFFNEFFYLKKNI